MPRKIFSYILILTVPGWLLGQACCTSGTPILGSLELPATPPGELHVSVSYEYNHLEDLVLNAVKLDDRFRRRFTHSLLTEIGTGLTDRFSVSGLLSIVQQERQIRPREQEGTTFTTRGVGDAVLLAKYVLIPGTVFHQRLLSIGAGPKIPTGGFQRRSDGVVIPYDMQPGTGAWDAIVWVNFTQGFRPLPLQTFLNLAYRATGVNRSGFEFGNEFLGTSGISYTKPRSLGISLLLKVRHVTPDRRNGAAIANTGGFWISMKPALHLNLSESVTLLLGGQLPLYRQLNGLQLSTSYRLSLSTSVILPI